MTQLISNVRVGKPDTDITKSAHVRGVREGNETGSIERSSGFISMGRGAVGTARQSTGINPDRRDPIHPDSPNLSPA